MHLAALFGDENALKMAPSGPNGNETARGDEQNDDRPKKPSVGGGYYVEHGSSADADRNRAQGVTPLWTVFHLWNYFSQNLGNSGDMANFLTKTDEIFRVNDEFRGARRSALGQVRY